MQKKLGLETNEVELYKSLFKVMEETGADFTNTFRALSEVESQGDNESAIQKLVGLSAPKDFFIKKVRHPHADNPKMTRILAEQPEILKLYGMDPDQIREEIKESKVRIKDIEENFDSKFTGIFEERWRDFCKQY